MRTEFRTHGSQDDIANFEYVYYGRALETHMPAHVIAEIEQGWYHGGKLAAGEFDHGHKVPTPLCVCVGQGVTLDDFISHPTE